MSLVVLFVGEPNSSYLDLYTKSLEETRTTRTMVILALLASARSVSNEGVPGLAEIATIPLNGTTGIGVMITILSMTGSSLLVVFDLCTSRC